MTYPGDDESYNHRNKSGDGGGMWIACVLALAVIGALLWSTRSNSSLNNSANGSSFESIQGFGPAAATNDEARTH